MILGCGRIYLDKLNPADINFYLSSLENTCSHSLHTCGIHHKHNYTPRCTFFEQMVLYSYFKVLIYFNDMNDRKCPWNDGMMNFLQIFMPDNLPGNLDQKFAGYFYPNVPETRHVDLIELNCVKLPGNRFVWACVSNSILL